MKKLLCLLALSLFAPISSAQTVQPANTVLGCGATACAPSGETKLPAAVGNTNTIYVTNTPYNAYCDDSHDDADAVQSLVNTAGAGGYSSVRFPDGAECKLTHPINVTYGYLNIIGGGFNSTVIDFEPAITITGAAVTNSTGSFSCTTCSGLTVGETVTLTWAGAGGGTIGGYSSPTTYYVSAATNGTPGSFTLQALPASTTAIPTALSGGGAGAMTSPTWTLASASAFRFGTIVGTPAEQFNNGLIGISFRSADTSVTKTAIELIDVGNFIQQDVYVAVSGVHWTGGSAIFPDTQAGSIGIRLRGRDINEFQNYSAVSVDRPIVFSPDPNIATESIDTSHFSDLYLGAGDISGPHLWVDSGTILTNIIFDGYEGWNRGTYGVHWEDTSSTTASSVIRFDNVRWERSTGGGSGCMFDISTTTSQIQTLAFYNDYASTSVNPDNGFCFHGVFNALISGFQMLSTGNVLQLDSSDYGVEIKGGKYASGNGMSIANQVLLDASYLFPNSTVPSNGHWINSASAAATYDYTQSNAQVVGAATGGYQGVGTINATNLFINGTPAAPSVLARSGIPLGVPPNGYMTATGVYVIGAAPANSATASFSGTSGSVTVTFSAATLTGTTAGDVNRVLTILDTTYKYCTITASSDSTNHVVATCLISGGTLQALDPLPTTRYGLRVPSRWRIRQAVVLMRRHSRFLFTMPTQISTLRLLERRPSACRRMPRRLLA